MLLGPSQARLGPSQAGIIAPYGPTEPPRGSALPITIAPPAQGDASLRGAPPFVVLYLDIDNFKDVNDTLGHAMGDLLLKEVVNRLKHTVRPGDLVARFGGDEFAGNALAAPFSINGHKVRITSSIGIALYSPEVAGPEAMMMQADLALYGAKDEGRNCFRFHSQDLDLQVHERVRVADELRVALEQGELELYYQPRSSSPPVALSGSKP